MIKKIFISYYNLSEVKFKNELSILISFLSKFFNVKDKSVLNNDIHPLVPDNKIAKILREKFIKDSNITIVIVGNHSKCRKFIDVEIDASLKKFGSFNRRLNENGLLILLTNDFIATHKNNSFTGTNFLEILTPDNVGLRIYKNCQSGYAIINSFNNVILDNLLLPKLIEQSFESKFGKKPFSQEIMKENLEICSPIMKNESNSDFKQQSDFNSNLFNSNINETTLLQINRKITI